MSDRAYYEELLGPAEKFILNHRQLPNLRKWAIAAGFNPVSVSVLQPVELTNLYHKHGMGATPDEALPVASEAQRYLAQMFASLVETLKVPGFNADLTRVITREEVNGEACRPALYKIASEEIQRAIEAMPPRRFEIAQPNGTIVQLDGPLHYMTETVIRTASLGHPIMMVGPAGCGKTTIGEHAARALNLPFYITNVVNDTHELMGFIDGSGAYHPTAFRYAFQHGGVWVADEIDAWDASALLAANSALANGYANFPDSAAPISRHPSFRMVATANTFGTGADRIYIGRNELDAASLDRFAMIEVDYDLNLERMFANGNTQWLEHVWKTRKIVQEKKIRHVVSSRAIAMGSAALQNGEPWNNVEKMYLFKGMNEADRKKVTI